MRSRVEGLLRVVAFGALGALLIAGERPSGSGQQASGSGQLREWSTASAPERVHVTLDSGSNAVTTAWLGALTHAGTEVGWRAPGAAPVAVVADPVADPAGATRVLVASPDGAWIHLGDAWGALDSLRASGGGGRFIIASAPRFVVARSGALTAASAVRDSLSLGRIMIVGHAGWESKFVAAALEERGWRADLRMALSPRGDVLQGSSALDTATHAAVIVLDSSAAPRAPSIARFVAQGGGLIMTPAAMAVPAFAALSPGPAAALLPAVEPFDTAFAGPRQSLALSPLRPRADAVALEGRGARVAVAARRAGQGRVAVVGYEDTWRWRLAGAGDAPEAHRAWWSGIVASVAHAAASAVPVLAPADEAPMATLVGRLGRASDPEPGAARPRSWEPVLCALLLVALLAEWTSRRLRGRA